MPSPSLYRRILGSEFARLAPVLRQFHESEYGGQAAGRMTIEHGSGWLARGLAWLFRLPPAMTDGPVTLAVSARDSIERWDRTFGSRRLVTRQWQRGALLVESLGLVAIGFAVSVENEALHMATKRVWYCGLPVPAWLGPGTTALAVPAGDGWTIDVHVTGPLVGTILRYRGKVTPQ